MSENAKSPVFAITSLIGALVAALLLVSATKDDFRFLASHSRWAIVAALFGALLSTTSLVKEEKPLFIATSSLLVNLITGCIALVIVLAIYRTQNP